jgi:DNA-binding response OmpR family regulator
VRVHLADDHTLFREGLASLLAASEGVEVVGTSPTGEEATELVAQTKPDLILTQLDMDLNTAEEILSGIREASPDSRIVVLTVFDSLRYLKALSKMGIDAYVHKSSSPEELIATLDVLSRQEGGHNAVISMPRGMLERLGEEPAGGPLGEGDGDLGAGGPWPLQRSHSRAAAPGPLDRKAPPGERLREDRSEREKRGGEDGPPGAVDRAQRDHPGGSLL